MRLKGLDLNLLVALDVLLEERSVSKAAARLHITQPAASAALNRLRKFFDDQLLITNGKTMFRTEYAENILFEVKEILKRADSLISTSVKFDPKTSERTFKIMTSDYACTVLMPNLINRFREEAPNISLDLRAPNDRVVESFTQGEIDLLIVPSIFALQEHPSDLLFKENHVVIGWSGNPLMSQALTEQTFLHMPHVSVAIGSTYTPTYAENELLKLGIKRNIEIYAPSFTAVPWLLLGTERIAIMHERLAKTFAAILPIKIQPLPFKVNKMYEMMQYHQDKAADAGLTWLRERLKEEAGSSHIKALVQD